MGHCWDSYAEVFPRLRLTEPTSQWGYAWDLLWGRIVMSMVTSRCPFGMLHVYSEVGWWWRVLLQPCGSIALCLVLHLSGLLGLQMVGRSALQVCSTGAWSATPPRRVSRQGLGRLLRLVGLVGRSVMQVSRQEVGRPLHLAGFPAGGWSVNGPKGDCGPTFGYPVPRYPTYSMPALTNRLWYQLLFGLRAYASVYHKGRAKGCPCGPWTTYLNAHYTAV
jgi:hypothetical protein